MNACALISASAPASSWKQISYFLKAKLAEIAGGSCLPQRSAVSGW